ncbi:MAG: VanW family protein [Patescibacteria group bacterium]
MSESKAKNKLLKTVLAWTGITVGLLFLLFIIFGSGALVYAKMYEGKIYPGVKVLNIRLDGLTQEEARKLVDKNIDVALANGLSFTLNGQTANLSISSGTDSPDLVRFDADKAVKDAYKVGRESGVQKIIYEILRTRIYPMSVPVNIELDEAGITAGLKAQLHEKLPEPKNATFNYVTKKGAEPEIKIIPEADGSELDLAGVFEKLNAQAKVLNFQPITLHVKKIKPQTKMSDLEPLLPQVESILARPKLKFAYDGKIYAIPTSTLATWITVNLDNKQVTLDKLSFASSIRMLAKDVEAESKTGKLEIKDGKIVSFKAGTVGRKINIDKTLDPVLKSWPPSSTFPLIVEEAQAQITGDELDQFGIKELIGVGTSDYRNSPPNRLKNIKKAVNEKVNGVLIAPGETFSMLKALGPVDGVHGWFPELVIKGNKTLPEFGGGLCQIGTTMFRAAIATGLPVVERRNHSYRVVYYEPAGTDATIYEPSPDLKYTNDTGKYIYINAYIKGTIIYFEMWGTKDGRIVTQTKPSIYNIVSPPPTKLTETLDLAPGVKKCTESAHAGADADFSTTIIYADGQKRDDSYHSHYRPWQAVCLIGVEKLTSTDQTQTASSTETP